MKKLNFLLIVLICLTSCSTDCEKAVSDWIQTDQSGTWTDLKFKLIEVVETKNVTVSDSIQILQDRFDKKQSKNIAMYNNKLERLTGRVTSMNKNPFVPAATVESYRKTLKETETALDSIKSVTFKSIYDNREKVEILAVLITCKYSIVPPVLNTRQEKTETFLLSPDLKKCLARMKVPTK